MNHWFAVVPRLRLDRLYEQPGAYLPMMKIALYILWPVAFFHAEAALDTFGITEFYATRAGTLQWNSAHWNNGHARLVQYEGDPYDPTGWTDNHSSSSGDSLFINGNGLLLTKGSGPRFHINSTELYSGNNPTPRVAPQSFLNTEATGYYRRLTTGGAAWDGMEMQVRTGPLSHASAGGNVCDATGLASRFRDDGKWDWEKELKHPSSTVFSTKYNFDTPLFGQGTIPLNRWIGMKFIVFNVDNNTRVKLETYIDSVSDVTNGPPQQGGHWELVGSMIDSGSNWPGGDISGCPDLSQAMAVTVGHGTMLLRTDGEACTWKMVSFREIDPNMPTEAKPILGRKDPNTIQWSLCNGGRILRLDRPSLLALSVKICDLQGRIVRTAEIPAGAREVVPGSVGSGVRIVTVSSEAAMQRSGITVLRRVLQ